jgi:hypothetical protein
LASQDIEFKAVFLWTMLFPNSIANHDRRQRVERQRTLAIDCGQLSQHRCSTVWDRLPKENGAIAIITVPSSVAREPMSSSTPHNGTTAHHTTIELNDAAAAVQVSTRLNLQQGLLRTWVVLFDREIRVAHPQQPVAVHFAM